ncbi:MAG: putative DNA binding domain-containing protein [Saprospiraceae bacterium]|nr:putative DNA binding domain-containing protein [Saprospiraceae bacterium]
MEALAVINLIAGGETSRVQFKVNVTNATSIAQEMVAFANTKGGKIIIGVNDKTGEVEGLIYQDIQRINNLLATAASEHVKSAIHIETDSVEVEPNKRVIVAHIPEGYNKPYKDKDGLIFIKNGSDKRKVTSNEELMRMLQSSGNLYAEEIVLHHCSYGDIDWTKFRDFFENKYKKPFIEGDKERMFENLRLGQNGYPLLAGALLFTKYPEKAITGFFITAIWFFGNERSERSYVESENILGTLREQYDKAMQFLKRALSKTQQGQPFNSLGKLEIPESVFEELLTNALIHRDYFIKDTIKLFIYENRIEIISPGTLPNSLTVEQMKVGIRKKRNNILDSLAPEILEYRGAGSGVLHALEVYPYIEFINDTEAEQFTVIIQRPKPQNRSSS